MVAKVAGGIIGLGLIGTGGVAFVKPEWLGINREVPWIPLSQDKDFSSKSTNDYPESKFGGKHKNYLTGITGKEDGSNDAWWQKSYEQWKKDSKDNLGNKFKSGITGAVRPKGASGESDNNQYLKDICDAIYKANHEKVTASPDTSKSDEYKEADVWKYCSPLGQKPKTIQEVGGTNPYSGSKLGKSKEAKLISVTDTSNDKFWEIRDKEFKGLDGYDQIEQNSQDKFFKNTKGTTIKELCEKAYGQNAETSASSETAPTETQAIKYCSLDKQ